MWLNVSKKARQAPKITSSGGLVSTSAMNVPYHAAKSLFHMYSKFRTYDKERLSYVISMAHVAKYHNKIFVQVIVFPSRAYIFAHRLASCTEEARRNKTSTLTLLVLFCGALASRLPLLV